MDIRSQVKSQVDELLKQGAVAGRHQLGVQWNGGRLQVDLVDVQPLACALWQLEVRTDQTQRVSADQLSILGEQLVKRVHYLLEPLSVHEFDQERVAVQLRSSPPQRESTTVSYYEVTAQRDGGWRLVRYEKERGHPRQQVPALVTLEVLQRLCQDVADVASSCNG